MKVERVSVAIKKDTHSKLAKIAELLDKGVREALDEAAEQWAERNTAAAKKKANQLLAA